MATEAKELPIRRIKVYVKIRIRLKDKRMSFEFPKEVSSFGEASFFWKPQAKRKVSTFDFRVSGLFFIENPSETTQFRLSRKSFDF